MTDWEFARPELLYLLLFIPLWFLLVWPWTRRGVLFTRSESVRRSAGVVGGSAIVLLLPRVLRAGAMAALIVALAHPQSTEVVRELSTTGKGMGLAVDLSSSMLAGDMERGASRIDVAREAAIRFAENRPHDELSLIGFSGEALTRVPPTTDPNLIVEGVRSLEVQLVRDGTDISAALLTTLDQLMLSEREPRVIVLLTDGAHNGVGVPPLTAARAAEALGVRVHAISVLGPEAAAAAEEARQMALARGTPSGDMQTVLSGIAQITGGEYFHATTAAALDAIYEEISRIEAPGQEVTESEERRSNRTVPLLAGLLLLTGDLLLRGSRWGVIP